jgi:dTDP-4-amino-4,6-dideoxygalactose transaminase
VAIPHVDVRAQYAPLIGELQEAFTRTLESGRFIFGPEVTAFEEECAAMLGVQECVSCANGTDALVLVLDALGIGPGDEVICPSFTFYATAEAIARIGATPVFAEVDPVTLNLDPVDVERRVTDRTKAIIPVHLFGRPAQLEAIQALGLPVVEDAAQAFGAAGIGSSIASTFSFFPTKNLFALGDGGLISVNDSALAHKLRLLRFHGSVGKKEFLYVGYNSRLDAMQAAFLRIFLKHIARWNEERREAADRYRELLDGIVDVPVDEPGHVYHQFCVRSPERDRLAEALGAEDIATARYYEPPLHLQPALRHLGYSEGDFPVTEQAARENLCLPLWAGISEEQQREVVAVLQRAVELVVS